MLPLLRPLCLCRSVGSASTWSLERISALAEECTVTFYAKLHVRRGSFKFSAMLSVHCNSLPLCCCGMQAGAHAAAGAAARHPGPPPASLPRLSLPACCAAMRQDLGVVDTVLSVAKQVPDSTLLTLHTDLVKSYPTQLILVSTAVTQLHVLL